MRSTRILTAAATALTGLATTASSLSPDAPPRRRLLEAVEPASAHAAAHALGVVGGLLVLGLAAGVLAGRRSSARVAVVALGVLALVHIAKGLDYEEAGLGLAVAVALRRLLRGLAPSCTTLPALTALVGLAAAYATTLLVLLLTGRSAHLAPTALRAAATLSGGEPATRLGLQVGLALAAGAVALALRELVAPAAACDGHSCAEHARAARLVGAYGDDSIAPFALRADKAFHFAHGGVLAFRALGGTAIVAGDPIGPPGSAAPILASFMAVARARQWDVVLLGATAGTAADYARLGLRTMQVGLEAVVDPRGFSLDTPSAKTVRKAVRRVERHGWTVEVVPAANLDLGLTLRISAVEAAWRRRHRRLYGFAWAGDRLWGAPEDTGDVYVLAQNAAGELRAFQRYVPYRRGLSLDAMRRLDDEPNGIADSLVAAVLAYARDAGHEEVSLNFSAFGHLMAADTVARRSQRLARWALRRLHRRFQLERLARFTAKFGPSWRPRYLVYTSRTRLPVAALRIMQAEAYLRPPRRRLAPHAWLPAPLPTHPDLGTASR
jgi:lysyl-tRNA synthetase, class II